MAAVDETTLPLIPELSSRANGIVGAVPHGSMENKTLRYFKAKVTPIFLDADSERTYIIYIYSTYIYISKQFHPLSRHRLSFTGLSHKTKDETTTVPSLVVLYFVALADQHQWSVVNFQEVCQIEHTSQLHQIGATPPRKCL